MNMHTRIIALIIAASFALAGCGQLGEGADDAKYSNAVPESSSMAIEVPGGGNGALALGETAEFYTFTKEVSDAVNGHVAVLLAYMRVVTLFPATERGENFRVWGPTEPQGLENISYRLRVEEVGENRFSILLDGRRKGDTGDFLPLIMGEVTPGAEPATSTGVLNLLYDNANEIEAEPCRTGTIIVEWDNTIDDRTVGVQWDNFVNCRGEEFTDVTYEYVQSPDFSGTFEFNVVDNIHFEANKPGNETISINSRWMGDGTGRSDVVIEGDEIQADLAAAGLDGNSVKASQCWDDLFLLTFSDTEPTELEDFILPEQGESSDCPFETPDYPQL